MKTLWTLVLVLGSGVVYLIDKSQLMTHANYIHKAIPAGVLFAVLVLIAAKKKSRDMRGNGGNLRRSRGGSAYRSSRGYPYE